MAGLGAGLALTGAALAAALGLPLAPCLLVALAAWLVASLRGDARPRTVLVVALLTRLPFLFLPVHGDDLFRYVWEGRVQLAGHSPYAVAPDDARLDGLDDDLRARVNHPELPTIYPPLAQGAFAGLAAVGLGPRGFRAAFALVDLLVVGVLLAWLRATGRPPGRAVLYAWSPVAVATVASGHVDPLMLLALAGFGFAWERGRARTAAALLGAAILAKTVALLLVPWLLVRRPRALLAGTLPVVVLGCLPWALQGDVVGSLPDFGRDFAFHASLFRGLEALLGPQGARAAAAALLALWTALVALGQPRPAAATALVFAGLLALSPTVHLWYLTWFLVALPAVGPRRWTAPLLGWAASVFLVAPSYLAVHAGGAFRERFAATWLEYAVPVALLAWALATGRPRRPPVRDPRPDAEPPGSFAVVMPCLGEAASLREVLPAWVATGAARVLVADTPTGDGTAELVAGLPGATYLPVERRGYGEAAAAGIAAAGDADFVVIADADHDRGPEQVRALLAPFADPAVGLVTAARLDPATLTPPQRAGNALASLLVGLGWGRRFHDFGAFRALRTRALPLAALTDRGYGWNVEMNVRALERGWEVVEVALPPGRRRHGTNRISATVRGVLAAGWGILSRIFRLREQACARPS